MRQQDDKAEDRGKMSEANILEQRRKQNARDQERTQEAAEKIKPASKKDDNANTNH